MPITEIEALELGQVLGSLLGSVVQAQAESARATVDFVEDVGFEEAKEGERMRTVKLRYTKKDENDEPAEFEVEVPLLALVNVPSLAVKKANLTFSYDVVTAVEEAKPSGGALPIATKLEPARLKGFVRSPTGSTSTPTTSSPAPTTRRTTAIDLDVTLEQQEMPLGVERLFDLAELGITERPAGEEPA